VTTQTVLDALQRRASTYDKGGEQHYDIISAFIKSVRGSDPDAAVRLEVAQRLRPELLPELRHDPDWRVRYEVASRIAVDQLPGLDEDRDSFVRDMARSRLPGAPPLPREVPL